jgi:hypothetical protein
VRSGDTSDHVVPQNLFVPPLPVNVITVPCCEECNQEKRYYDDYLRDVLVADLYCAADPLARNIAEGKMARAISRNRSDFARAAVVRMAYRPLNTPGGIYLGEFPTVPLDSDRLLTAIAFVVRGLYYSGANAPFPANYMMDIRRVHQLSIGTVWESIHNLTKRPTFMLGDGVFACDVVYGSEDWSTTFWVLAFYRNFVLTVATAPGESG